MCVSDLQFQFYPYLSLNSTISIHTAYNWNLTVFRHLLGTDGDTFTMSHPTVLRPKSVGSLGDLPFMTSPLRREGCKGQKWF